MATRRVFLASAGLLGIATAGRVLRADEKIRFAIIVAKDNPIAEVSFYDLRRLYKGEAVNLSGQRLVPFNLPLRTDRRIRFDHAVLDMSPEVVSRYWIDRRIRGQPGPPKVLETPEIVQHVIGRLEGGIAYVRADEARADVKTVRVDGKMPNERGYRIEF